MGKPAGGFEHETTVRERRVLTDRSRPVSFLFLSVCLSFSFQSLPLSICIAAPIWIYARLLRFFLSSLTSAYRIKEDTHIHSWHTDSLILHTMNIRSDGTQERFNQKLIIIESHSALVHTQPEMRHSTHTHTQKVDPFNVCVYTVYIYICL